MRFGGYTGGVVAAETTEPRAAWHGEAGVRLLDAGGLVEGPFADGRGTALAAGRYSYTAALVSLLVPDCEREWGYWLSGYRVRDQERGLRFKPLCEIVDEPYTVYFPVRPRR